MHLIDIITITLFSLVVFLCGMSFSKSGTDMKSFFSAGGAVPWWISGLSLFMSFFSAGTFVVWGSIAYTHGLVSVSIQWTMAIAGLIIGTFIAGRWNREGSLTVAEFISKRLGRGVQKVYTYLFLVISLFTTGAFLYPVAKIVEISTSIPIHISIVTLGILITLYTATGGLWAVIVTDVLQFIVLTAAVFIVIPLSFEAVGGLDNFIESAPVDFFHLFNEEFTPGFMVAFGLYNLFFIAGNWAYVQRYTSVKSPKDAKKVGWMFGALYIVSPVLWMLPPMIYRAINPELAGLADEGAYLLMCKMVLPSGMLGLIVGGMIFATSSSVNTTLNISAGVFTNDIFKRLYPNSSERTLMRVAKWATTLFGLFTIIVALLVPLLGGIVDLVLGLAAITGGAMFLPPLWALLSKRLSGRVTLSVTLTSLIVNSFIKFITPIISEITISRELEMAFGVGVPITLLIAVEIVSIATSRGDDKTDNNRVRALDKSSLDYTKESSTVEESSESAENIHGVKVIALGIIATGILISILGAIHIDRGYIIISVGLVVLTLGAVILRKIERLK